MPGKNNNLRFKVFKWTGNAFNRMISHETFHNETEVGIMEVLNFLDILQTKTVTKRTSRDLKCQQWKNSYKNPM